MATRTKGRDQAVERVTEVFRARGYDGAALSELSEATGLGRSSLYHYFPGGKADMARASLGLVSGWIEALEAEVLALPTHAQRLERLARGLDEIYAGGRTPCLIGALSVATEAPFEGDLTRALRRSTEVLSITLTEAGAAPDAARTRAEDAIGAVQGALILTRVLSDRAPFERALAAIRTAA